MRSSALLLAAGVGATLAGVVSRSTGAQAIPTARPEAVGLSPTALARIGASLEAYVDSGKLAGVIAVIARHGKIAYSQTIGHMDVERAVPMRSDAVFRMYSMTKPVIAVAILKLYERGALRLDDPVAKYVPAFGGVSVYSGGSAASPTTRPPDRPPTIEDLLTHTAGLSYGAFGATAVDSIYRLANLLPASRSLEEFADSIARLPLMFSPGTAWNYGRGYDVLARIVEVASGRTVDRFLEEEVFAPLGMKETAFHVRPDMEGRIPVLYSRGAEGRLRASAQLLAANYLADGRMLSGSGGLLSTPADYLRLAQMLLNGGKLQGHRILKRESVALMLQNHLSPSLIPIVSPLVGQSGYGQGYGGVVLVDSLMAGLPGSPGIYRWWGYVGTFFWIDPKADLIAMVWTQFTPGRAYPLEQDFQRLVYAALVK